MQNAHKRTPLPWTCIHQGNDTDFCIHAPKEADGCHPIVAIVLHQLEEIKRVGSIKNAYSQNGEFIVRACNAHDELVAALRESFNYFDMSGSPEQSAAEERFRALIAKAEG